MTVNTHRASADKPPPGKLGQEISISWGALRQGASCASISWRRKKGPDAAAAIVASAPRSKERALRPRIQIALHGAKSAPTRVRPPPMIPKRRSRNGLCVVCGPASSGLQSRQGAGDQCRALSLVVSDVGEE